MTNHQLNPGLIHQLQATRAQRPPSRPGILRLFRLHFLPAILRQSFHLLRIQRVKMDDVINYINLKTKLKDLTQIFKYYRKKNYNYINSKLY